jgi:hypothetical protein
MIYLLPVTQIAPGAFQVKTNDPTCLENLAIVLHDQNIRDRVNMCLFNKYYTQDESHSREERWLRHYSRSKEVAFVAISVEDYTKWSKRLTPTESEGGVILAVEVGDVASACFNTDKLTLQEVTTELFFPQP